MKFIHLSDIHIGKSKNKERFDTIVRWIIDNANEHGSQVVVITGDLVDDGALGQYREVQAQIARLKAEGFTILPTPGNHDYGTNGIIESHAAVARYEKYVSGGADYPHLVVIGGCAFVLLDSMLQEMIDYELWGAQGELGEQQLSELDRILNEIEQNHGDMKVVVALHHHPFYYNHFLKLRDNELFKKVIMDEERGDSRVDCLLFGHKHTEKLFPNKETKYNIGVIYASGSSTERDDDGRLIVPVIDLSSNSITRHLI